VEAALVTIAVVGPVFGFVFYVYRLLCRILSREPEPVIDWEEMRRRDDILIAKRIADIQRQATQARTEAREYEAPEKQCQGCGAFGKGHRCFYCKRTYTVERPMLTDASTWTVFPSRTQIPSSQVLWVTSGGSNILDAVKS